MNRLDTSGYEALVAIMLQKIGTDEAWNEIETFAKTRPTFRDVLVRHTAELEKKSLQLRHGREIIAGQMQPDELLPPPQRFVWTEAGYVLAESDSENSGSP